VLVVLDVDVSCAVVITVECSAARLALVPLLAPELVVDVAAAGAGLAGVLFADHDDLDPGVLAGLCRHH